MPVELKETWPVVAPVVRLFYSHHVICGHRQINKCMRPLSASAKMLSSATYDTCITAITVPSSVRDYVRDYAAQLSIGET